jgi:NAD(P)-dependent dehydrogenase (short-subunit alcohol dehydrogenase family)
MTASRTDGDFVGATALVTGATAGIGREIALTLAARGAEVVVHGRNAERGAATVQAITAAGGRARFVAADLADPASVDRLAQAAGAVDVLVNNAAVYEFGPLVEATAEFVDLHIATNVRAPVLLVAALAPGMMQRRHGSIVNISTGAVDTPVRAGGVYVASKAALNHLTLVWADEFGSAGVRVNTVAAGPTRTEGMASYGEEVLDALGAATVLGRVGEPSDIAEAVAYLASDRAAYVTGTVLHVRGGIRALG